MVKDAELHKEEDAKRREEVEIRNDADALVFRAQKSLDEYQSQLPDNIKNDVQTHIDALKKALEGDSTASIKTAKDALESHMQKIGETMAQAQQAAGAAAGAGPQTSTQGPNGHKHPQGQASENENIEEAEVEIIEDEEK